ncbi:MAG: HEAT repeat domain-containing protein [Pirellulales bacterium]|nr:HEAT repeat domain-containing protein [Pirellulales bacterium]
MFPKKMGSRSTGRAGLAVLACAGIAVLVVLAIPRDLMAQDLTPDSPEVRKLVDTGLTYLETHTDDRFGAKCLVGLAFLKAGRGDHARVGEAIAACEDAIKKDVKDDVLDMYSNGLAIIFLCEASPKRYAQQIEWFLGRLKQRQKEHGGWGYANMASGDTSQSQYAALSYWEANRHGFAIDGSSIDRFADWLLRTQDPAGCWGYQGIPSTTDALVEQNDQSCSMLAAGLGSLYICADLFGMQIGPSSPGATAGNPMQEAIDELPSALRRVDASGRARETRQFRPQKVSVPKILLTIRNAHGWMAKNYTIDLDVKSYYYLYGLERYKSFQEALENSQEKSPKWYNEGYQFLKTKQAADGSWSGHCGAECDTAFSILFLLRSTQKSINAKLSEGMLLSGRGLPTNFSRVKLRNGELIADQVHTKVDQLLSMIDDGDDATLDDLARDPSQLVVDEVDEKSARRLQQLVRGGEPEVRMLAVRALGRSGNLDYVPTLLYALTDPDHRVVLEARNELRFISRNFNGYGPPDDFTDQQRYEAIEAWKKWYLAIRPAAALED